MTYNQIQVHSGSKPLRLKSYITINFTESPPSSVCCEPLRQEAKDSFLENVCSISSWEGSYCFSQSWGFSLNKVLHRAKLSYTTPASMSSWSGAGANQDSTSGKCTLDLAAWTSRGKWPGNRFSTDYMLEWIYCVKWYTPILVAY
jgi:hypothetical protein